MASLALRVCKIQFWLGRRGLCPGPH